MAQRRRPVPIAPAPQLSAMRVPHYGESAESRAHFITAVAVPSTVLGLTAGSSDAEPPIEPVVPNGRGASSPTTNVPVIAAGQFNARSSSIAADLVADRTAAQSKAHFLVPPQGTTSRSQFQCGQFSALHPQCSVRVATEHNRKIEDLQNAHAALSSQVCEIAAEVQRVTRVATATEQIVRGPESGDERILRRALSFAKLCATRALKLKHREFSDAPHPIVEGNSIRQVFLRSKAADCTLEDFRLMVSHFSNSKSIRCTPLPSEYYILFSSCSNASTFEVRFECFRDLCDALDLPADICEKNIYKERSDRTGDLRCVQVLGVSVETCTPAPNSHAIRQRKNLLAHSVFQNFDSSLPRVHVMHQRRAIWTNNAWETGFEHSLQQRFHISDYAIPSDTSGFASSKPQRPASLHPATSSSAFSISWEQHPDSPNPQNSSAAMVLGFIRVVLPAVILRSRVLTRSTQDIFTAQYENRSLQSHLSYNAT